MKQYRVTKYNPALRDSEGRFTKDEWISYSEVGKSVTKSEYERIESAYIESAIMFLKEQDIRKLKITYLENSRNYDEPGIPLKIGSVLNFDASKKVMRSILREKYWAKLEIEGAFIHIGYDYYMYIG